MSTFFPDFPRLFDAPPDVVRELRVIDPTADLLYAGWGTWRLVRYRPNPDHSTRAARALTSGRRMLREWETDAKKQAVPGAFRRLYGRYLYWEAVRLGARPVAEYDRRFIRTRGFAGIIEDFRQMEFRLRHTSDTAMLDALTADKDKARAAADAELRDEHAAVTMAEYLAKQPHSVTARAPDVVSAAVTRTPAPSLVRSA